MSSSYGAILVEALRIAMTVKRQPYELVSLSKRLLVPLVSSATLSLS